jgi:hypothetical protein
MQGADKRTPHSWRRPADTPPVRQLPEAAFGLYRNLCDFPLLFTPSAGLHELQAPRPVR